MIYENLFLLALLLTVAVETALLFIIVRLVFKDKKISNGLLLFTGIICSFATLPYLWFILPFFLTSRALYLLVGELSVFLIEAIIIYFILKLDIRKALLVSFICNLVSFLLGLVIFV